MGPSSPSLLGEAPKAGSWLPIQPLSCPPDSLSPGVRWCLPRPFLAWLGVEGVAGLRRVLGIAVSRRATSQDSGWDSPGHRQLAAGDQTRGRPVMKTNTHPRPSVGVRGQQWRLGCTTGCCGHIGAPSGTPYPLSAELLGFQSLANQSSLQ